MSYESDNFYKSLLAILAGPPQNTPKAPTLSSMLDPAPPTLSSLLQLSPRSLNQPSLLTKIPDRIPKKNMALKDQLIEETTNIFKSKWEIRAGQVVPSPEDLQLGNDAVTLDATILYADMRSSTAMVNSQDPRIAAKVYKAYLGCAARIIKAKGGTVTAYDGDRIMAVFRGESKNTVAAETALKINWALQNIVNPGLKKQYGDNAYQMGHVIGVDTSKVLVGRIGVRNDNDLVWVGRAANYAAKLCAINENFNVWITDSVFDVMHEDSKYGGNPRELMWKKHTWTQAGGQTIYGSSWTWSL